MGLIKRFLGRDEQQSQLSVAPPSQYLATTQGNSRRELLRIVLRDTLQRAGIPPEWIVAEVLNTTARTGERGVHWRLLLKHWDPRLMTYGVALQQALIKRVTTFDPMASSWLQGISWQFALDDESACPTLPPSGSWTSTAATPVAPVASTQDGGVIEGPVRIAHDVEAAKADLDRLLAIRDADFQRHAGGEQRSSWSPTEPAKL